MSKKHRIMSRETDRIIGHNIAIRRNLLDITQNALAEVLKISTEHIREIEQGADSLSVIQLFTLARFFNCSIDALCGFQPIDESPVVSLVSAKDILDRELPENFAYVQRDLQCALYKSLKILALTVNVAEQKFH